MKMGDLQQKDGCSMIGVENPTTQIISEHGSIIVNVVNVFLTLSK